MSFERRPLRLAQRQSRCSRECLTENRTQILERRGSGGEGSRVRGGSDQVNRRIRGIHRPGNF